jgi:hypothetical protein
MNFKHFTFIITLLPFLASAMEKENKPKQLVSKEKKSSKKRSQAIIPIARIMPKNTAPVVTHITSWTVPITFRNKTCSLFEWMQNPQKNHFGRTPMVKKMSTQQPYDPSALNLIGPISNIKHQKTLIAAIAGQYAIYISNTSKKRLSNKKHCRYGTILLWKGLVKKSYLDENEISKEVRYAANQLLSHLVIAKNEKLQDKKITAEEVTIELQSPEEIIDHSRLIIEL